MHLCRQSGGHRPIISYAGQGESRACLHAFYSCCAVSLNAQDSKMDHCEQAAAKAREQGLKNLELREGDVENAVFPAHFDAILLSAAIPYLADIPAALHRFCTWLKPGGRLLCNTPQAREMLLKVCCHLAGRRHDCLIAPMANQASGNVLPHPLWCAKPVS